MIEDNYLQISQVGIEFPTDGEPFRALQDVQLKISKGEFVSLIGHSGCGKSTLLNLLAGLDMPSQGEVLIDNKNIANMKERQRTELRAKNLGFVYQFHHLLKDFSAIYNTALPLLINDFDKNEALTKAENILKKVGLESRTNHKPSELSGGERQRVAIARAMITEPACLLADEPTGNLDERNAKDILDLIIELNSNQHTALLIVTHDLSIANKMSRQLELTDGHLNER